MRQNKHGTTTSDKYNQIDCETVSGTIVVLLAVMKIKQMYPAL